MAGRGRVTLIRPPGRHLDVDDRDVRLVRERLAQERVRVTGLAHDIEPALGKQTRDPLAHQDIVLPDDYAQGL